MRIDFAAIRAANKPFSSGPVRLCTADGVPVGSRFAPTVEWQYAFDTLKAAEKIPAGTVSEQSHQIGMRQGEPLIVMMDALFQYAAVYAARYDGKLAEDNVLGEYWLDAAKGIRGLLNGDGSVAMQLDRTTDSKDNGAIETMFWNALEMAGFKESDL